MGFLKGLLRPGALRSCLKCGSTWTVPRHDTKRHSTEGSVAPLSSMGGLSGPRMIIPTGSAGDTVKPVLTNSTGSSQIRANYGVCPKCGSNTWAQKRLWFSPGSTAGRGHNSN